MAKGALITGITGQDCAYLAEFLLKKGYEVHGIKRRASSFNTQRIDHLYQDPHEPDRRLILHYGDMTDSSSLTRIIQQSQPDEIYNLAAQSHVAVSFEEPEYTADSDGIGTLRLLEAMRILGMEKKTRFYQASTSELYGKVMETPQKESTPFYPRSPYGVAKLYAYWITVNYREAYGMFACNGILFNHESPIRGETFVTRKVTRALARIALGVQDCLYIGNLNARRDWGHAKDYVQAQWLMLQQPRPEDYVIATGESHSVREFIEAAAAEIDLQIDWKGNGADEVGVLARGSQRWPAAKAGQTVVRMDPRYLRPSEVETLLGDATKAREQLGWKPRIGFRELVTEMMEQDLRLAEREDLARRHGHTVHGDRGERTRSPETPIYVAGHRGLAGSALVRRLRSKGYRNLITRTHAELDLTDAPAVREFLGREKPGVVLLAAAKAGGILANDTYPAQFIHENLAIQTNVIHEAFRAGVAELLFLGSSCIYPRDCPQPIKEEYLLTGPLEPTNRPYAIAKIAGIEMCWSYNRQYGTRYFCAMPTNLYGPGDNYDLQTSHVLPALMRKFHEARLGNDRSVTVWGTGTPRREFLHSDDMADACIHLVEHCAEVRTRLGAGRAPLVNVGCGEDQTIAELAAAVREAVGSRAEIVYDRSKPDGTPQKLLDISLVRSLGWQPRIALAEGLRSAYEAFVNK